MKSKDTVAKMDGRRDAGSTCDSSTGARRADATRQTWSRVKKGQWDVE